MDERRLPRDHPGGSPGQGAPDPGLPGQDDPGCGRAARADVGAVFAFACAACGAVLTGPLRRLSAVPEAPYGEYLGAEGGAEGPLPATVPSGCYAIEPEPYGAPLVACDTPGPAHPRFGAHIDAEGRYLVSQGPRGNIVINPDDARGLELEHAAYACCGASPDGGMNQLCACGTLVATLSSDCWAPYELHLSPRHVRALTA
ncbi:MULTISPECIES: hypothetical protein [unclassified Streptomyces]|uniref:hypothetical protein n=1 Tax=unclassified Streptomyces TaxID=2593676 RepID=UPI001BE876E3|nr:MULTISPECIES: hypothetical protein [unclassified Streptomyces]MBT2404349.1 hypothetical protein [Streptomyces sp. ISL-21]MBT2607100.1 hypothetical protein [Streptomyces sp. ISL-87]